MELTVETVHGIFEETNSKWDGDNALKGLLILNKYFDNVLIAAEHDKIYSVGVEQAIEKGITENDIIELAKLNWMLEDGECFACFV